LQLRKTFGEMQDKTKPLALKDRKIIFARNLHAVFYVVLSQFDRAPNSGAVAKQVEQLTTDPKFEGSNPTTAGSGENGEKDR
jgi:hypothetical protein